MGEPLVTTTQIRARCGYSAARVSSRFLHVVCLVAALATMTSNTWAAGANDADVRALIRDIYDSEVASESYQGALDNLNVAKVVAKGTPAATRFKPSC